MTDAAVADRLYFRQLLSGRDFAKGDQMARQMVNFVYLIGDRVTGEAVVVDPAYAVQDLLDLLEADGMTLTGVLGTHYHADHVGGEMAGWNLEADQRSARAPAGSHPSPKGGAAVGWSAPPGSAQPDLVGHDSGDVVQVGEIEIELDFTHIRAHAREPMLSG